MEIRQINNKISGKKTSSNSFNKKFLFKFVREATSPIFSVKTTKIKYHLPSSTSLFDKII